jgi:adenylate cyclase
MKITLLVEGTRHAVELTEEGVTIGRGEAATIRVASNAVSRVHAKFFLKEGLPHVVDLKSLNGTSLHGDPVATPAPLSPGDTVLLGEVAVQWEEEQLPVVFGSGINALFGTGALKTARGGTEQRLALEDRAFDASGSIMVPHADLEGLLARHKAEKPAEEVESLYQRLATMAGKLMRAANLQELLEGVMTLITSQIRCQRGSIVLLGPTGELEPEFVWEEAPGTLTQPISRTIARTAMNDRVTILTTDARVDPRFAAGESIKIHGISSVLCAPLIVEEQGLGAIYLESNLGRGGFNREDEHLLSAMANFVAMGVQREREARFRQRLERYHSPQVVSQILLASNTLDAPLLQAQRCEISILFADISGFTRMSEGMEPMAVATILNRSFEVLTDQVFQRGGTLDKYIGDAIMAFFGAPAPDPDHARHAVEAAIAMQQGLQFLNANRPEGYPELRMRIGINSGEAFAGDIGCEKRMDYTVMGSTVNLASRLESGVAKPGMIVIGPHTARLLGTEGLIPVAPVTLKGIEQEVTPFEVPWS